MNCKLLLAVESQVSRCIVCSVKKVVSRPQVAVGVCSKLVVRTVGNAVGGVPVNVIHVYMVFSQSYVQISGSRNF